MLAPERTIKSIKRKMGQDVKVKLGDQEYRPQEISAMILRACKRPGRARSWAARCNKAVITVPAYFNDAQRQATREAGELAGLEVVRILNEPTAASLTYDPSQRELRRMLVYDLGGGTFDVSIVQAQEGVVEVLASHGDTQLGGDDFDDLLLKHVCDRFQEEHGVDLRANLVSRARVLRAVEAAKRQLSYHPFARIEEEFIAEKDGQALHLNLEISRAEYEELIRPLLDRTMDCVQRALDDAHLTGLGDRQGGAGRRQHADAAGRRAAGRAARPAGRTRRSTRTCAWRWGRPIQAAIIAGADVGRGAGGHHAALAGHQVPGRVSMGFDFELPLRPDHPPQHAAAGLAQRGVPHLPRQPDGGRDRRLPGRERRRAPQPPRRPASWSQGLAPVPAGNPIVVQLDLNLDGMLKVSAREQATGLQKQVAIENALARFEREERDAGPRAAATGCGLDEGDDEDEDEDDRRTPRRPSAEPSADAGARPARGPARGGAGAGPAGEGRAAAGEGAAGGPGRGRTADGAACARR